MKPQGWFYTFEYAPANTKNGCNTVKVYACNEDDARRKAKARTQVRAARRQVAVPTQFTLLWKARS